MRVSAVRESAVRDNRDEFPEIPLDFKRCHVPQLHLPDAGGVDNPSSDRERQQPLVPTQAPRAARGEQITFEINGEAISYKDAAMYGARALASFYARPADQRPEGGRVSDREIVETSLRIFFAEQQQKQVQKLAKAYLPEPIVMPEATPDSAKGSQ